MTTASITGAAGTVVDGVDVEAVAAAIRRVPGVDDLAGTPSVAIATYLPGRRVEGVRADDGALTVQVRARWGQDLPGVGHRVQRAAAQYAPGWRIDVTIGDIADPPAPPTATPAPERARSARPAPTSAPG